MSDPIVTPGSKYIPAVAARRGVSATPFAVAGAVGLGVLVFLALQNGRTQRTAAAPPQVSTAQPPGAGPGLSEVPVGQLPIAEQFPNLGDAPLPGPTDTQGVPPTSDASNLNLPALIVDLTQPGQASEQGSRTDAAPAEAPSGTGAPAQAALRGMGPATGSTLSVDERFAASLREADGVRAEPLAKPGYTVIEGTMIAGVLETAINSDLPGLARAVISRDVRSFDGARVLIPAGSRVIGQYKSGVALGQSRAFVIWNRLIRPDGASINLASPGADSFGRGGLEGRVDRHFLRRFGGSILLSLVAAVIASETDTSVIIAGARGGADAASIALQKEIDQPPTIQVAQGAPIRIFVARDLDFSTVER